MSELKVKICGLRDNLDEVLLLQPDYIGLIFCPGSKRYVNDTLDVEKVRAIRNVKKVGVFVDQPVTEIRGIVNKYQLDYVQLHGNEPAEDCSLLKDVAGVIKVFSGNEAINHSQLKNYGPFVDYFLFDTRIKNQNMGGTGEYFEWGNIKNLPVDKPVVLSGGIGPEHAHKIKNMDNEQIVMVDVNSKFEISPALKNTELLKRFLDIIRNG